MANRYWRGGTGTWASSGTTHWAASSSACQFTASRSGTTLTVSAVASGAIAVGMTVWSASGTSLGTVNSLGTGTGGTGTYTMSASGAVASTSMAAATVGAAVPTTGDVVVIDADSTIGTNASTLTITATAIPSVSNPTAPGGVLTIAGSAALSISGSWELGTSNITWSFTGTMNFTATTSGWSFDFGGTISNAVTFSGVGGVWTMSGDCAVSTAFTHTGGTVGLGGHNFTMPSYAPSGLNAKALDFGTGGTVTLNGTTTATIWNTAVTGLTISGTGTVSITGGGTGITQTINSTMGPAVLSITGSGTVSQGSGTTTCGGLTVNNAAVTYSSAAGGTMTCTGDVRFVAGTITVNITLQPPTGTTIALSSNGHTFGGAITQSGASPGTVQLADAAIVGGLFTFTSGTLSLNGFDLTVATFSSGGSATRTIDFGGNNIILTGSTCNFTSVTGLTLSNASGSKISFTGGGVKTFQGGTLTWPIVEDAGGGGVTVQGSGGTNTFPDLQSVTGVTGTWTFTGGGTTDLQALSIAGSSGHLITIKSSTTTNHTFSMAAGTVSLEYCDLIHMTGAGGATWNAFTVNGCVDGGSNVGWNFKQNITDGNVEAATGADTSDGLAPKSGSDSEAATANSAQSDVYVTSATANPTAAASSVQSDVYVTSVTANPTAVAAAAPAATYVTGSTSSEAATASSAQSRSNVTPASETDSATADSAQDRQPIFSRSVTEAGPVTVTQDRIYVGAADQVVTAVAAAVQSVLDVAAPSATESMAASDACANTAVMVATLFDGVTTMETVGATVVFVVLSQDADAEALVTKVVNITFVASNQATAAASDSSARGLLKTADEAEALAPTTAQASAKTRPGVSVEAVPATAALTVIATMAPSQLEAATAADVPFGTLGHVFIDSVAEASVAGQLTSALAAFAVANVATLNATNSQLTHSVRVAVGPATANGASAQTIVVSFVASGTAVATASSAQLRTVAYGTTHASAAAPSAAQSVSMLWATLVEEDAFAGDFSSFGRLVPTSITAPGVASTVVTMSPVWGPKLVAAATAAVTQRATAVDVAQQLSAGAMSDAPISRVVWGPSIVEHAVAADVSSVLKLLFALITAPSVAGTVNRATVSFVAAVLAQLNAATIQRMTGVLVGRAQAQALADSINDVISVWVTAIDESDDSADILSAALIASARIDGALISTEHCGATMLANARTFEEAANAFQATARNFTVAQVNAEAAIAGSAVTAHAISVMHEVEHGTASESAGAQRLVFAGLVEQVFSIALAKYRKRVYFS